MKKKLLIALMATALAVVSFFFGYKAKEEQVDYLIYHMEDYKTTVDVLLYEMQYYFDEDYWKFTEEVEYYDAYLEKDKKITELISK